MSASFLSVASLISAGLSSGATSALPKMLPAGPPPASTTAQAVNMESLFDLIEAGGPMMYPIGLCSIVALAYATERWIRLRSAYLGSPAFSRSVLTVAREKGFTEALELCSEKSTPLARILGEGLRRAGAPSAERDKAVEDVAYGEVRRLSRNLRPLMLIYLITPLLGLLGTVWGMIGAFSEIATEAGLGKPELLADGIYKALMTTAGGLAVAIPAIVLHHFLKGRIELFVQRSEEAYRELDWQLQSEAA